ncbi:hypothetical protein AGMMS49546_19230 [Spirochaetia bacterium]|nr:hypothetical protein AGMMS49546_19230 [Spirochaetia bacterium]
MPQVSLYIDSDTLKKVEKRARQDAISISKWVGACIKKSISNEYPENFLKLCGALKDMPFEIPPQGKFEDDSPREPF